MYDIYIWKFLLVRTFTEAHRFTCWKSWLSILPFVRKNNIFLSKRFSYERINKMITSSSLYMFHLSIYLYNEGYFIIRIMGFIILIQIAWIHFLCAGNRIVDIYAKNWVVLWTYCKYCIIFIEISIKYCAELILNILYMNKIIQFRWLLSFE